MNSSNYDVVIVGAGCAGLTAAIGLARAGFAVAVVEAAVYPGAENWSGCVYFCENLADATILGPDGVEALAWERRLVERGFFACDGHSLLGMTYRDPEAFRHCYTVLRPVYDHHLAQVALRHGAALLTSTTAESLIRGGGRVVGVCTNRGPLYADLVFLAEGDASNLVTREGYERFTDQREAPKFLQGIKQVIELPPGAIEDRFGVGAEQGVAYEMLLRNGTLRGKIVRLNMGGFVYTNRRSLSVGLVLPTENLADYFGGDPNLLIEWFEALPALRPWLQGGQRAAFGAKLIRGGGARDVPVLIDDGLAIGGAASAVGVDFPYPNFTGPATAMGLLLTRAAVRIRAAGGRFTREELRLHYLEPLQRTHYWHDVEFLRRWPGYVKKTRAFFGRDLDLALGSAYIWTRPRRWSITKWTNWLRMAMHVAGPKHWPEVQDDLRHLSRALRLRTVVRPPDLGRLLLDGTVNALRDLFRRPRPNLPAAGHIRLLYSVAGGAEPVGLPPVLFRRWFNRFATILAPAAKMVYANDTTPLPTKLQGAAQLLVKQVNLLDVIGAACFALAAGVGSTLLTGWERFRGLFRRRRTSPGRIYPGYAAAARRAGDMTPLVGPAAGHWESRLGQLAYQAVKENHIHVLWPRVLQEKNQVARDGLWHVCPAHVYEARVSPLGQLQVVVNFENCIKCETCWRTSNLVDWGRDGRHRFIYPIQSPALLRLIEEAQGTALSPPVLPRCRDPWGHAVGSLDRKPGDFNGRHAPEIAELERLLGVLEGKLVEFDAALEEEPRTVDRARAGYLEMLTRYAHQVACRILEVLRRGPFGDALDPAAAAVHPRLLELASALAAKAEERARRAWDQRYAWAAADGRQLRWHHLVGLRRLLGTLGNQPPSAVPGIDPLGFWLRAEDKDAGLAKGMADVTGLLDRAFPTPVWRALERHVALTTEQDQALRGLLARIPPIDPADLAGTLHPPLRKAILAELGRRDPSLAYRVAVHLWARDLAQLATVSSPLTGLARRWAGGDEWAAFAVLERTPAGTGQAFLVPAGDAQALLVLWEDRLYVLPVAATDRVLGLTIEAVGTLGLRGAGLRRVEVDGSRLAGEGMRVDPARIRRIFDVVSAADLTSIAAGMADQLCRRTVAHATSRVQFPGLFHDEEARDTIGKFGAVKKMVAEMGACRYLIETLDHALCAADFSSSSVERAHLVKTVVADALGTAPGSLSYNAGQVFGGTGYSEDDILAKFYRDAAAWRFLGPANQQALLHHGEDLLRGWRADGQRLAGCPGEIQLFEELAQRKALQAELDEVRVLRSRLRGLVGDWLAAQKTAEGMDEAAAAEISEHLGRQDALLLASKALLLRTHARLERGLSSETETSLVRVWLDRALAAMDDFESMVRGRLDAAARRDDRPMVEPGAGPPVTRYADFLATPAPYNSGDFLCRPVDLTQPRYVPEMNETDPELSAYNSQVRTLLLDQFGKPRDGLIYERYIESRHRPDPADLDFCRQHGFFRLMIPRELGGEGRRKADYYLVTTGAQRLADVAISLTIQVNTSIGTTPVLLARDKDLPKAQKELGPFVGDTDLHQEVRQRLEKLRGLFAAADPRPIETAYRELQKRLGETILARSALRSLGHHFIECWQAAGRAGLDFNLPAMQAKVQESLAAWKEACARAPELHAELARRREACDLFLRWVAAGQISAFALTEPSAGSDTARVATRAKLRAIPVEAEPDGVLRFVPEGGKEPRYLLDARRLEFRPDGVYYRWSDHAEASVIHFEEYDYETDDPGGKRWYDHGGRKVYFTDIAQLRERAGRRWYDYFELTGSKMWITNGRMAGIMCLYAKTGQGVTGFIVDRHAEGLVVGKDEEKLGQNGSPTNELSLQAVRVPWENILGLEGRGQVNALETLNVGRAGLAMSAMTQMPGLTGAARAFAEGMYGGVPGWVAWRLERMAEHAFTAEALAHDIIGRFEHAETKSVRLESAAAKMLVSELLHRVIEMAEEILGPEGQTTLHLVEKRKRDARILNIYEGTNEVQRFTILKDLVSEVVPRWRQGVAATPPQHLGREALELEALKGAARQQIDAAVDLFGPELWQNPNLQANCFLLAEAAAWLAAAESTLGRLAWLSRQIPPDENSEVSPLVEIGRRALARCGDEVRNRLRRFDEDLTHLRRGYYAPEIRAASLLFKSPAPSGVSGFGEKGEGSLLSRITRPLSIMVVVEPTAAMVPEPYVVQGRLVEPYLALGDADRAALESALRIRDQAEAPVSLTVALVGPRRSAAVLREALSLGADHALLVAAEPDAVTADSAAAALAGALKNDGPFDLILGGGGPTAGEEGQPARLTAEALDVPFAGMAPRLAVNADVKEATVLLTGTDGQNRVRPLPAMVAVEAGVALRPFTVEGYLAGLEKQIHASRWPRRLEARPVIFVETKGLPAAPGNEEQPHAVLPKEAGLWVLREVGLGGPRSASHEPYGGPIADVDRPSFAGRTEGPGMALVVVAADAGGRLGPTARQAVQAATFMARTEEGPATTCVVLVAPGDEGPQRLALGELFTFFGGEVVLVPLAHAGLSGEERAGPLAEVLGGLSFRPLAVVGEPWTEPAFARLALGAGRRDGVVSRVHALGREEDWLVLETTRSRGKLRARQKRLLDLGQTTWITLAEDAEIAPHQPERILPSTRVERWALPLAEVYGRENMHRLLSELKADTGLASLADAEFIIDVGFGVGNRDGYEAVIAPLERALRDLGVRNLAVGGSRKITEELHLLPPECQIGQSGVSVNPRVLLAIGISGAPQHLQYIGPRAKVLAFNRDPEAPLMTLNQRQAQPKVYPVVGDLFETVPALIEALRQDSAAGVEVGQP
jgi:electron transfer flavoprotein-quinone oxidoreductase